MPTRFRDRADAGRLLATRLSAYANRSDVLVLALPRGGLPVAFEVARALDAPLDLCVVRKLGVPGHEELAMGAIASGGAWVLNDDVIRALNLPGHMIQEVAEREVHELRRREQLYRGDRPPL
jgi:putative phosphoribosyl transferase